MAAAPGAVPDLEIPTFSLERVQDCWEHPGVWPYNLQEGETPTITFMPFQSPTGFPKQRQDNDTSSKHCCTAGNKAAFPELEFLTFVL